MSKQSDKERAYHAQRKADREKAETEAFMKAVGFGLAALISAPAVGLNIGINALIAAHSR